MNLSITKVFDFAAAHRLPSHAGKCKNLHGHNYKAEVTVTGAQDMSVANGNMVVDFGQLEGVLWDNVFNAMDHSTILPIVDRGLAEDWHKEGFKTLVFAEEPTVEVLATKIFTACGQVLDNAFGNEVKITKLRLYETESCWAEVSI